MNTDCAAIDAVLELEHSPKPDPERRETLIIRARRLNAQIIGSGPDFEDA
jgi:hypothetical protein